MCNAAGNVFDAPMALHNVGYCDLESGRFDAAESCFETARSAFRERNDARGEAMALSSLGVLARRRGQFDRALEHSRASLALAERMGTRGAIADAIDEVAQAIEKLGDFAQAKATYRRALDMARELGQVHLQCFVLLHLARAEAASGGRVAAAATLRDALGLADKHDFQSGRLMGLLGAAGLRWATGDRDRGVAAGAWCRAVLALAADNVDIRAAVPDIPHTVLDVAAHPLPERALELALADAAAFLDTLIATPLHAVREKRSQSP
jgi:tetratricopeptide (TPR) repeat protein